jgi:hypothetical protein
MVSVSIYRIISVDIEVPELRWICSADASVKKDITRQRYRDFEGRTSGAQRRCTCRQVVDDTVWCGTSLRHYAYLGTDDSCTCVLVIIPSPCNCPFPPNFPRYPPIIHVAAQTPFLGGRQYGYFYCTSVLVLPSRTPYPGESQSLRDQ